MHTHAPYLTAFAYCNKDIKLRCSSTFALLFEDIPCLPYGQPGTKDIANGIEEAIKEHDFDITRKSWLFNSSTYFRKSYSYFRSW